MNNEELESYLTQCLNMSLLPQSGESSYTNSFSISVLDNGVKFTPRFPCSYVISESLYNQIYTIISSAIYPMYTLLKQNSTYFIPIQTDNIHIMRALFFPWDRGIPERLIINDIDKFVKSRSGNHIPLMKDLTLNFDNVTSLAIAGNSGSGKSYFLTYLLYFLKKFQN